MNLAVLVALGAVAFASSPPLHPISKLQPTLLFLSTDEKALTEGIRTLE
jgi:hypothetical protein